ncbi:MAG TPA: hypothetical protein VGH08_06760 [Chthoniobacterales bacterium]
MDAFLIFLRAAARCLVEAIWIGVLNYFSVVCGLLFLRLGNDRPYSGGARRNALVETTLDAKPQNAAHA